MKIPEPTARDPRPAARSVLTVPRRVGYIGGVMRRDLLLDLTLVLTDGLLGETAWGAGEGEVGWRSGGRK